MFVMRGEDLIVTLCETSHVYMLLSLSLYSNYIILLVVCTYFYSKLSFKMCENG